MKNTLVAVVLGATLSLAACGGSDGGTVSGADAGAGAQRDATMQGPAGPGGSGEVVAVSGSTAQVQDRQGQVAVSWNDDTTFTRQVDADASALAVGACVMVQGESADDDDAVAATTVRITPATDEGCAPGGGARPGGRGAEGMPEPPEGATPPEGEDGAPRPRMLGGAFGEVTAVDGSGFTVTSRRPGNDEATTVTVTTDDDTAWTTTAEASASDVRVGRCVVTQGEADDTGALTATSIAISEAVDGECGVGFAMRLREER